MYSMYSVQKTPFTGYLLPTVSQGLFQVVSRDTPSHLERKGLVDLRYMTIRIEIIFGSSLFFFSLFSLPNYSNLSQIEIKHPHWTRDTTYSTYR